MAAGDPVVISPETVVHRIGGGDMVNLRLKPREETLTPPGMSVLIGGRPAQAAEQMREAFPDPHKFARIRQQAEVVGWATVASIREAGFEILADPSHKFPNHARITHPNGVAGFCEENLERLSRVFQNVPTPRS